MSAAVERAATLTAAALLVAPVAVLAAGPAGAAGADVERHGSCGGGTYEAQVDREDGRLEAGLDLDALTPGSRWTLVIRHDGQRVARATRTADREGDVELEVRRPDTAGADTFRFIARPAQGQPCAVTVRVR